MLMPSGKHRGRELEELPDTYLLWLAENVELREPLLSGVWSEFKQQGIEIGERPTTAGGLNPDKVKAVYRELSLEFHPDRGGNTEAMKAINLFYEKLTGRK